MGRCLAEAVSKQIANAGRVWRADGRERRLMTDQSPILTDKFDIHDNRMVFTCTARGHLDAGDMLIDEVTVNQIMSRPSGRTRPS